MDPAIIGTRLASAVVGPLVRKLFVTEGPGAGVVGKPVRISGHVSFTGEKRTLTERDLRGLAAQLVRHALRTGERPIPADEQQAVTHVLAATLHALGDLTITDLDAVRLGPEDFARELRGAAGRPERELSADATHFYERLLHAACLHILHFFTQRSTFVAHTLVEQTRAVAELTAKIDELIRRSPLPGAEDAAFEREYLEHVAKKHGKLTIYGIDLSSSPRRWPLAAAYLSLEATPLGPRPRSGRTSPRHVAELLDGLKEAQAGGGGDGLRNRLWELHGERRALEWDRGSQPVDRALADHPRVLLRGEAGSGKTTLVQWLAVVASGGEPDRQPAYLEDRVPFVLPLRTLTRHGERLPVPKDFLAAICCPLDGTQPAGWEHRVLAAGRGLVLVDGIDEVPDAERERARRWLRELLETYDRGNRWLITSRPSAVGENWLAEDGFTELMLAAMGPADIETFIRRWHDAARTGADADDAADLDAYENQLLAAVIGKPDLGRLATNPLMCGLICALHRDRRGYLPHGRKDLYEAALSMLLSRRDRERDLSGPELREEPQLDLLQRLAYWLIKNGRTEMDRAHAEDIIGRALHAVPEAGALGDAAAVFEHFLQRSGLLREPALGTVDFVHRTFQDYLGARAAVEEADFGLLADHAADDQWEDVIRLAVALARPRERIAVFEELLTRGDRAAKRTQARIYLLTAACLEHATSLDPAVREAVEQRTGTLIPPRSEAEAHALAEVGPLILGLLPGPEGLDYEAARYVVVAASRVKSEAAVPFLARFAAHPSEPVRIELLQAWSRFDGEEYADEVIAHLDHAELSYAIRSDAQLGHLNRLGLRPARLDVRAGVSAGALAEYFRQHSVDTLALSGVDVADLGFLTGQSRLRSLMIRECPALADISALGGLPVEILDIDIGAPGLDIGPVGRLTAVEHLAISGPSGATWTPAALPTRAPLRGLVVSGDLSPERGLGGLAALSGLLFLELSASSSPAAESDWAQICSLPSLGHLMVSAGSLEHIPSGAVLPETTRLTLVDGDDGAGEVSLSRVPGAFPALRNCEVLTGTDSIDVAPLAALPELFHVFVATGGDRIRGGAVLPPTVHLGHL